MTDVVLTETHGHVRVLKLHRPEKLNALNNELSDAIADAIEAFEADSDVRVMVIGSTTSRAFSAGADMREAVYRIEASVDERTRVRRRLWAVTAAARKPLIGAIEGYCLGAGGALAMLFDIRVCGANAKFQNHSAEYGVVYGAATLAAIIGPTKAKEIILTGRMIDAEEAVAMGIFNVMTEVGETLPAALAMAQTIAQNSPAGLAAAKMIVDATSDIQSALRLEEEIRYELLSRGDHKDRFRDAFAHKVERRTLTESVTPAASGLFSSRLRDGDPGPAITVDGRGMTYAELRDAALWVAEQAAGAERVAVWMTPSLESCVAVVGALLARATVIPINPKVGSRELAHIAQDSRPDLLIVPRGLETLPEVQTARLLEFDASDPQKAGSDTWPTESPVPRPAMILYTSGTTGPPKGVMLSREAIAANLDALASAWQWTDDDTIVHGLPLFHVHGLILGVLGPLRRGSRLIHVGRFAPSAISDALAEGASMVFGVPTMYSRLLDEAERDDRLRAGLSSARLLVSGSAPLPVREGQRLLGLTGQRVVERYGLTETLIVCTVHASGDRRLGYVGMPLDGVEICVLADDGTHLDLSDDRTIGELAVRSPSLFSGYLNGPVTTDEALRDGWFLTGDLVTRAADGYIRIVGRRSTDIIKTGGFKVGVGEVESAILEHTGVDQVAVVGEPDAVLGERVVAYVVARNGSNLSADEVTDHVGALLARHKCPQQVHFVESLPRNEMGKVLKRKLGTIQLTENPR